MEWQVSPWISRLLHHHQIGQLWTWLHKETKQIGTEEYRTREDKRVSEDTILFNHDQHQESQRKSQTSFQCETPLTCAGYRICSQAAESADTSKGSVLYWLSTGLDPTNRECWAQRLKAMWIKPVPIPWFKFRYWPSGREASLERSQGRACTNKPAQPLWWKIQMTKRPSTMEHQNQPKPQPLKTQAEVAVMKVWIL